MPLCEPPFQGYDPGTWQRSEAEIAARRKVRVRRGGEPPESGTAPAAAAANPFAGVSLAAAAGSNPFSGISLAAPAAAKAVAGLPPPEVGLCGLWVQGDGGGLTHLATLLLT